MARQIHGYMYRYFEDTYMCSHEKTQIECLKHGFFYQTPKKHIRSQQGCRKCYDETNGHHRRMSTMEFIEKAKVIHGNRYIYDLVNYKNARTPIRIICPKHGEFRQKPNAHIRGNNCPKCANIQNGVSQTLALKDVLKRFQKAHDNKYDYSLVQYHKMREKVDIICKRHGIFSQTPQNHANGVGCPKCYQSKGESTIEKFLKKEGIKYVPQKKFDGCHLKRRLRFDFYLPEYQLCIEFDGMLHFYPNYGKENLERTQRNDCIKTDFCEKNGIELLRIPYTVKNIPDFLREKLSALSQKEQPFIATT